MNEKKRVHFNPQLLKIHHLDESESNEHVLDIARESNSRFVCEKVFETTVQDEMKNFKSLLAKYDSETLTVVFGNLGRRPHLLTYFLDFCFTHAVRVGIKCSWLTDSPYQIQDSKPLDYLFILEPYFGADLYPIPDVKHTIILTSHLCLTIPERVPRILFQVDGLLVERLLEQPYIHSTTDFELQPTVFYNSKLSPYPEVNSVLINVTNSSSALETYLKLLNGREISKRLPYKIHITPRDLYHLKSKIQRSQKEITSLWKENWLRIYWEDILNR